MPSLVHGPDLFAVDALLAALVDALAFRSLNPFPLPLFDEMKAALGFFDVDDRLRRLSDLGDQLEVYGEWISRSFRPDL